MDLFRELPTEKNKNGIWVSYGEFLCSFDNKIVKKQLSHGYKQKSCGCQQGNIKHGGKGTKLYGVWKNMKQRILNPNHISYKNYGGRGITICPEWTNDYTKFRDWALSNKYAEGLQINRKENDDNYEPSNCNFVTAKENMKNTRRTKHSIENRNEIIELYKTGRYTYEDLAKKFRISKFTITKIINNKEGV